MGLQSDTPRWRELLHRRGILDETIEAFNIHPDSTGWQYPVPGGGTALRWKAFDSHAKPKYRWLPGKPRTATYYHADGLEAAVAAANGLLWIAGGEPDVWALHSAGITNALSWYGETSVPPTLAEDLQALGVTEVHIVPDLDETGRTFARKIAEGLQGSGIDLVVHRLPEELGEKGDIGRAWQQYHGSESFRSWLATLPDDCTLAPVTGQPTSRPPAPKPHTQLLNSRPPSMGGWSPPPGFIEALEERLGVTHFKQNGFSNNVRCPFHDDQTASAGWHRDRRLLHCFPCGQDYLAIETGNALGIDWRDFSEPAPAQRVAATVDPDLERTTWETAPTASLPLEARLALAASRKQVNTARVLDALYQAGWPGGRSFTTKEAITVCSQVGICANTVRKVLTAHVSPENRRRPAASNFSPVFAPIDTYIYPGGKNEGKNQRGRPAYHFRLPTPADVCTLLGLDLAALHCCEIPPEALRTAPGYRIALYRALIVHRPGVYTRAELAKQFGVTEATMRQYDKPAGVQVRPRLRRMPITINHIDRYTDNRDDRPANEWIEDADGGRHQPTRDGLQMALLVSGGRPARHVVQLASHYSVSCSPVGVEAPPPEHRETLWWLEQLAPEVYFDENDDLLVLEEHAATWLHAYATGNEFVGMP